MCVYYVCIRCVSIPEQRVTAPIHFMKLQTEHEKEEEEEEDIVVDEIFKEGAKKTDIRRAVVVFFALLSVHCTHIECIKLKEEVLYQYGGVLLPNMYFTTKLQH